MHKEFDIISEAKSIFDKEIEALIKTRDVIGEDFETMVRLVLSCRGKVIITGMGKPGHIGVKIAATLASLGTPAFFMHPAEALHGETSADLSVDRERGFFPVPLKWGLLEAQPGHPFCAHFSGSGRM